MAQFGREVDLRPGSCTLIDSRYPFTIDNMANQDTLSIAIPTNWLLTWLPSPEEVVARAWNPSEGWGGVLSSALANLTTGAIMDLALPGSAMSDQIGALLALAAAETSACAPPVRVRKTLLDRLRDSMRGACNDPTLRPADVAGHHGISLRHLHLQFAVAGSSFGSELMSVRLSNSWAMLTDTRHRHVTIAEVAMRCGFNNASHFARRFRGRYGHSPAAVRNLCRD